MSFSQPTRTKLDFNPGNANGVSNFESSVTGNNTIVTPAQAPYGIIIYLLSVTCEPPTGPANNVVLSMAGIALQWRAATGDPTVNYNWFGEWVVNNRHGAGLQLNIGGTSGEARARMIYRIIN